MRDDNKLRATLTPRKLNAITKMGPMIKGKITRIVFEGFQYLANATVVVIIDAKPIA